MSAISQRLSSLEEFLWCVEREKLRPIKRITLAVGRVIYLAIRMSSAHQIFLRASALTLFSLLAVVPVLATLFGIAKGFGLAEMVEAQITEAFATQEQVMDMLVTFSKNSLEHAKGGLIAGIGVLILLWTVIRMIGNVEQALNRIWGTKRQRPLLRKFTDYLFLVILLPLLLVFSSSATVALTDGVRDGLLDLGLYPDIVATILLSARLIPALLLGAGFAFIYAFLPNVKVEPIAALIGGLVAALLFLFTQYLYVQFQFALASYGAIYGSFAALPLFLIWLQLGWIIILLGAEITRAIELRDEYEFEPFNRELSLDALFEGVSQIAIALKKRLEEGLGGGSVQELASAVSLPKGIVRTCCETLHKAEIFTVDEDRKYVPTIPTGDLEGEAVLNRLRAAGRGLPEKK